MGGIFWSFLVVARRTHPAAGVFIAFLLLSATILSGFKPSVAGLPMEIQKTLRYLGADSFVSIISVVTVAIVFWDKFKDKVLTGFFLAGVANSTLMIVQVLTDSPWRTLYGFFGNTSMSGCFSAICLGLPLAKRIPLVLRWLFGGLLIWNVYLSQSSMAYLTALVILMMTVFCRSGWIWKLSTLAIGLCGYLFGSIFDYQFHRFMHLDRIAAWEMFMGFWRTNVNMVWGSGTGSFFQWGVIVQRIENFQPKFLWLWMHSDWLQLIFENGIVGMILAIWAIFVGFRAAINNGSLWLLPVMTGYIMLMAGNYPTQLPLFLILGAVLYLRCFYDDQSGDDTKGVRQGSGLTVFGSLCDAFERGKQHGRNPH